MARPASKEEFAGTQYEATATRLLAQTNGEYMPIVELPSFSDPEILQHDAVEWMKEGDLLEARRCAARLWVLSGGKGDGTYKPDAIVAPLTLEVVQKHFIAAIHNNDYGYAREIVRNFLVLQRTRV